MELSMLIMGQPAWMWLTFLAVVVVLLVLDLGVLNKGDEEIGVRKSLMLSLFYITIGVAFGGFVWLQLGQQPALEYWTGFVVEKSLAMDNVFVMATIFGFFAVPRHLQHRVLFWGILGVIVLRAIMIGFGATLVQRYEWVLLVFAAFLIFTGVRVVPVEVVVDVVLTVSLVTFALGMMHVLHRVLLRARSGDPQWGGAGWRGISTGFFCAVTLPAGSHWT